MKIKTVYLDMDGVLFDFIVGYKKHYIDKNIDKVPTEELIADKKSFADVHLYRDLPLFKDAKNLVKLVEKYDVEIKVLTSVGKYSPKENAVDKVISLKKHFPKLASKFNYVTKSKDKSKYAAPDVLLIDDREKSTLPFKAAGGQVVLYTGFSTSKKLIEKLLKNDK